MTFNRKCFQIVKYIQTEKYQACSSNLRSRKYRYFVLLWSRAGVSDAHVRLIKTAIKQPCNDLASAGRVVHSRCSFSLSLCIPKWQQRARDEGDRVTNDHR